MIVTATMRELHEAHKARLARISARAYKEPAPPPPAPNPVVKARNIAECDAWLWAEAVVFNQSQLTRYGGTIGLIRDSVCRHFSVHLTDLVSRRRTADIVLPRQVAAYLCRFLTGASLPYIGKRLGGRDHTTILHACRRVHGLLQIMPELRDDLNAILNDLDGKGMDVSRLRSE